MSSATFTHPVQNSIYSNSVYDGLFYGLNWKSSSLSFSFIDNTASYFTDQYDVDPNSNYLFQNIYNFNDVQKTAIESAFNSWSNVAKINFTKLEETNDVAGVIRVGFSPNISKVIGNKSAFAYMPNSVYPSGGDIWFDINSTELIEGNSSGVFLNSSFSNGSFSFYTVLHEIGHSLGLKHPFDKLLLGNTTLSNELDTITNTVMSYSPISYDDTVVGLTAYPTTPMPLDIKAIQEIYGPNLTFNNGDTSYFYDDSKFYFETIWDTGGIDTINYSGNQALTINLNNSIEGNFIGKKIMTYGTNAGDSEHVVPNIFIAEGVTIENVSSGSNSDNISGNDSNNNIKGNNGHDIINSYGGDDILEGGLGNDIVNGGEGFDYYYVKKPKNSFSINKIDEQTFEIKSGLADGIDIVKNIERVFFGYDSEEVLALDVGAGHVPGQTYRLYQAAFAREPEPAGVLYHVNDIEINGKSLYQVSNNFLASPEFISKYGANLSDEDYINALYKNVLGRTAQEFEVEFYTDNFNKDITDFGWMDRAIALIGFAESPENISLVANQIDNGIWLS